MTEPDADHARIWLEPMSPDGRYGCEGRLWCQDKVWPDHEGQPEPTEYVRADLFAALAEERDRLREALAEAHKGLDRIHTALLSTGPKQAAGEMVAHFRDEAARALTGDTP